MKLLDKGIDFLKDMSARKSMRDLAYVYSSRLVTAVMRFAVTIVVARTLGVERMGILTIASVVMGIAERVLEMGLTTTMVRKMSLHYSKGEEESYISLFRRIYLIRVMTAGAFVVLSWFAAPFVAERIFNNPVLTNPLRLAAFGALVWNLWNQSDAVLRVTERFKAVAVISIASQVVRTGLILLFAWKALLGVNSTLIFNIAEVFTAFVITSLIIPRTLYRKGHGTKYPVGEIFAYSRWMFAFSVLFMLFDRLDVLMLGYFKQESEVGLYGVAFTMIRPFELLPETLNTIFLPKVSKFTKKSEISKFFRDTLKITLLVGSLCAILIVVARPMMLFFYGQQYEASIQLFQILVGAFILLTILNPFTLLGHTINKPQLFVIMASINLTLNFAGNLVFIPKYGAVGAAVVNLVSRVAGGILGLMVLKFYLNRWQEEKEVTKNGPDDILAP